MTVEEQLELLNFQAALADFAARYSRNKNEISPIDFAYRWYKHISKCDTRKIINIFMNDEAKIVLCNDGTLWETYNFIEYTQIKTLP